MEPLAPVLLEDTTMPGDTGVIAGFGPGITAEMAVGSWVVDAQRSMDRFPLDASAAYFEPDFAHATWK